MSLFQGLRKVITAIDKLRDFGLEEYIKLPRIVVVGSQSAGKSSLLEQIVGIDFLPRGSGVVTRRPLELRLIYEPKETLAVQYGEFKEIPGKKFTDFKEVKRMIEELTDKVCGKSKNIIDNPIILNVHSSSCPNLTLVDLPGITKVPIDDQPPNIGEITTGMCRKYIEDEKTIILCVVAANADLSTSDSLKLCRSIDKDGVRTLGCLTKIDLMDRGTNARNILLNKEIELKLGYVAIKNRSQEDINQNRSVAESLAFEKTFFSTSQIYSSLPPGLTGTDSLTNKLTNLLYNQIKKFMPELIREIGNRLDVMEEKKKKLGDGLPVENAEQQGYLWQMTSEFLNEFKGSIEGSYSCDVSNQCGPQIRKTLHELLEQQFHEKAADILDDEDIDHAIKYHNTGSIPGFPSYDAFLSLLVPLIKELNTPVDRTILQIYQKLEETASKIARDKICQLPQFREDFLREVTSLLEDARRNAQKMAKNLIDAQANYIFTSDYGYINCSSTIDPNELSELARSNPLIYDLRFRIDLYFKLVVRNLRDSLGKQIGLFMLNDFQKKLYFSLSQFITDRSNIDRWLSQPDELRRQRQQIKKAIQTLRNAQKFLQRDSGLSDMFAMNSIKTSFKQKTKNWLGEKTTLLKNTMGDIKDKLLVKKGITSPAPAPVPAIPSTTGTTGTVGTVGTAGTAGSTTGTGTASTIGTGTVGTAGTAGTAGTTVTGPSSTDPAVKQGIFGVGGTTGVAQGRPSTVVTGGASSLFGATPKVTTPPLGTQPTVTLTTSPPTIQPGTQPGQPGQSIQNQPPKKTGLQAVFGAKK